MCSIGLRSGDLHPEEFFGCFGQIWFLFGIVDLLDDAVAQVVLIHFAECEHTEYSCVPAFIMLPQSAEKSTTNTCVPDPLATLQLSVNSYALTNINLTQSCPRDISYPGVQLLFNTFNTIYILHTVISTMM